MCLYFDIGHPDVRRIIQSRDSDGRRHLFYLAQCKCKATVDKARRDDLMRWSQANLSRADGPRTFTNFISRPGTAEALGKAQRYATSLKPPVLLLVGETGTGKSHLLEAIGREVMERTTSSVRYDTAVGFLDRLRRTYDDGGEISTSELLAWYQRHKLILLDDLGAEKPTEWAIERLTAFIDERMRQNMPMAIATNLTDDQVARQLGPRLASRLYQTNPILVEVRRVTLTASDYRMEKDATLLRI